MEVKEAQALSLRDALAGRRSVRGFRPDPVARATITDILALASRSPSGTNLQPWKVWVVSGARKEEISVRIIAAREAGDAKHGSAEYDIYPPQWREPYLSRRRELGKDLYSLLGIERDDIAARERQFERNYRFFGAPVGLFFTIDRDMGEGSWIDAGMFMQSVMLAARAYGLETCPQQAFCFYHRIVTEVVGIPDDQILLCGMALGYADDNEPANRLTTRRIGVEEFTRFVD